MLSQALIVFQWQDAKAGTIANVLILVAVVVAFATSRFKHRIDDEVHALFAAAPASRPAIVRLEELERLPAPVRRWLEVSGVVGKERVRTVRLQQRGELRTAPDQAWMPAEAEQYFSIDPPGFVWRVDVKMLRVLPVVGRDKYSGGKGHMLLRLMSMVNIVDAVGDKIDQGTLLRFLGEIVWFPSAALSSYIEWEATDARSAKATMRCGEVTASAVFSFDEQGRLSSVSADRYLGLGGALERWVIPASEWRVIRGVEIPVRGDVIWKLKTGDFNYYRWEITDVEVNRAEPYAPAPRTRREADLGAAAASARRRASYVTCQWRPGPYDLALTLQTLFNAVHHGDGPIARWGSASSGVPGGRGLDLPTMRRA